MPRGGARPGAGRKPKPRDAEPAVVVGMDGLPRRELRPAASAVDVQVLASPPSNMKSKEQREFWRAYAPAAIEQQTLIQQTALGFRELAEQFVMKQQIAAFIEANGGAANPIMDTLLKQYVKLAQRVDASLARFRLTSFGKPAVPEGGKRRSATPAANPWAQVAGR